MVRRGCFSISQSFLERGPRSNDLGYPVLWETRLIGVDGEYCLEREQVEIDKLVLVRNRRLNHSRFLRCIGRQFCLLSLIYIAVARLRVLISDSNNKRRRPTDVDN